ncbi:MAG: hypothetical protein V4479_08445 [Actinomycetota bacterium]
MNKFVLLFHGLLVPANEAGAAWMAWFGTIADHLIDSGNPFGAAREVTSSGSSPITDGLLGYSIVSADSLEEAERMAATCTVASSVLVYEALPM